MNDKNMVVPPFGRIEKAIREILAAANADLTDENFKDTPKRVATAFTQTWLEGYGQKVEDVLTIFPNEGESDLVVVKEIDFYSMCSHHLAPFMGKGAIVYMPDKSVMGLSKAKRVIDVYARRLQLQERITAQVADALMEHLQAKGVMVVLYNVQHTCMTSRGVHAHNSVTTTQSARGVFKDSAELRKEAYRLIGL